MRKFIALIRAILFVFYAIFRQLGIWLYGKFKSFVCCVVEYIKEEIRNSNYVVIQGHRENIMWSWISKVIKKDWPPLLEVKSSQEEFNRFKGRANLLPAVHLYFTILHIFNVTRLRFVEIEGPKTEKEVLDFEKSLGIFCSDDLEGYRLWVSSLVTDEQDEEATNWVHDMVANSVNVASKMYNAHADVLATECGSLRYLSKLPKCMRADVRNILLTLKQTRLSGPATFTEKKGETPWKNKYAKEIFDISIERFNKVFEDL